MSKKLLKYEYDEGVLISSDEGTYINIYEFDEFLSERINDLKQEIVELKIKALKSEFEIDRIDADTKARLKEERVKEIEEMSEIIGT